MTANGCELVLQGGSYLPGLQVTRRCRVEGKSTGARFVDVFTNVGAMPLQFNAQVFLNCGNGAWQAAVSDSGKINPTGLDKKETGIVLFNPSQNGCVSVALRLAGPTAAVRPAIQPVNNGQPILFSYLLNVPPRKSVAILYGAAQCRLTSQPDANGVAAQLKPFSGSSWVEDLPPEIRRAVVNFGSFGSDFQWEDVGIGKVLARLEKNTGPSDILASGTGTRLKGTAACTAFSLETRFGTLATSLDKVVAVAGARDHSGRAVVLFRDGQRLPASCTLKTSSSLSSRACRSKPPETTWNGFTCGRRTAIQERAAPGQPNRGPCCKPSRASGWRLRRRARKRLALLRRGDDLSFPWMNWRGSRPSPSRRAMRGAPRRYAAVRLPVGRSVEAAYAKLRCTELFSAGSAGDSRFPG